MKPRRTGGLTVLPLPASAQRLLTYVNYVILLAFLTFVVIYGAQLAWISRARSFQGISWISYSWVTASLPFGGLLLAMTTIVKLIDLRRSTNAAVTAA